MLRKLLGKMMMKRAPNFGRDNWITGCTGYSPCTTHAGTGRERAARRARPTITGGSTESLAGHILEGEEAEAGRVIVRDMPPS